MFSSDNYGLKRAVLKVVTSRGLVDHAQLLEMREDVAGQFVEVYLGEFDIGAPISSLIGLLLATGVVIGACLLGVVYRR